MKNIEIVATAPNTSGESKIMWSLSNGITVTEGSELSITQIAQIAELPASKTVISAIRSTIKDVTTLREGGQSHDSDGEYLPISLVRQGNGYSWMISNLSTQNADELLKAAKSARNALKVVVHSAIEAHENDETRITAEFIGENFPVRVFPSSRR